MGPGGETYMSQSNSEYHLVVRGSQTVGAKLHGRKGNSPDRHVRSQIHIQWQRMCSSLDSWEVGLEVAIL